MADAKLVDAGIDYVRLTTQSALNARHFDNYYANVRDRDLQLGYEEAPGGAFGFFGRKVRHAMVGDKKDWTMLQVSGYEAKRVLTCARRETQCTRLDIQFTIREEGRPAAQILDEIFTAACAHVRPKSRPPVVKKVVNRQATETVYIGKRASDVFIRCYDKFAESGKEEYRGCVRYELELKGRASKELWRQVIRDGLNVSDLLKVLSQTLKDRGLTPPCEHFPPNGVDFRTPPTSKEDSTVAWLKRQVAPVIARMSAYGNWMLAFNTVFDKAMTGWERQRILRLLLIFWGS
jgi:hypothetical protein